MNKYKYRKQAGALQEAAPAPPHALAGAARMHDPVDDESEEDYVHRHQTAVFSLRELEGTAGSAPVRAQSHTRSPSVRGAAGAVATPAIDTTLPPQRYQGRASMFFYTIEEGQKMLVTHADGSMEVASGPCRLWRRGKRFRAMEHYVAHPGEFLIVRYRDGRQEHVRGPAHLWRDPREHAAVNKEELFQIAEREAIVVYSKRTGEPAGEPSTSTTGARSIQRRIVHGPEDFMPEPGEWVHTFSWHGSRRLPDGSVRKVPGALEFQKLWLLPDQMYHDVPEVRTADGAVLTIRLMIFFELVDIERMLATTHDPIGDFVNAATSDVVEFLSKHDFDSFKGNIEKLNQLETYKQLTGRAAQCGYRIGKVVYRGYGAPPALQQMQEQALESRTRLHLSRETENQAQELEDLKLERRLARSIKARDERALNQTQDIELTDQKQRAELTRAAAEREFLRAQKRQDMELELEREQRRQDARIALLAALGELGVELTEYLTQARSDQIIELRGGGAPAHLHLDAPRDATRKPREATPPSTPARPAGK